MKQFLIISLLAMLAGILVLSGCSKDSMSTPTVETGLNYEDDFGGYDTSDEPPGFGDETILEEMAEDAEVEFLEPEFTPTFDSLDHRSDVRVRRMDILWGMLEYDSTVTEVTDWSGSLEIERGAIRIATLIRFERGDYIVKPRSDCSKLEWVSFTRPHFDGILVFIYDVSDLDETEPNTVTFKTGPYERTFTMSELDSLSEIIEVDDIGNKVSFNSFITTPEDRERGFLTGRWAKSASERGVFFGRWASWDGRFLGHVRGHWGANNDGERVFFGKWISRHGSFKGLLRGTWGSDETITDLAEPASGWFRGDWADRSLTVKGKLGGMWAAVSNPSLGDGDGIGDGGRNNGDRGNNYEICEIHQGARGFFHGRWEKDSDVD